MLPFVIVGGLIFGKFCSDMHTADLNNEHAYEKTVRALTEMSKAQKELEEGQERAHASLLKLANRKKGIINTSIKKFIDVYSQLQKIKFINRPALNLTLARPLLEETINALNQATQVAGLQMSEAEAIHCLLFRGLILGATKSIVNDSERELKVARMRAQQAHVIEEQAETAIVVVRAVSERADKIAALLANLNICFFRSISKIEEILKEKGNRPELYSDKDFEYIMNCLNFADAVKKIIDAPIFDENGEITEQIKTALTLGDKYIAALKII